MNAPFKTLLFLQLDIQASTKEKESIATLISVKIELKAKSINKDKMTYFIMIKDTGKIEQCQTCIRLVVCVYTHKYMYNIYILQNMWQNIIQQLIEMKTTYHHSGRF